MIYIGTIPLPAGILTLSGNEKSITGLWIQGQKYFGSTLERGMLEPDGRGGLRIRPQKEVPELYEENGSLEIFREAGAWLEEYFGGREPDFMPSLAPSGSEFRQQVWKILCRIPYGGSTTYGHIAKEMAAQMGRTTMSAQAVGGAVGHNPISIMIPCHRVMGSDGSLTGYAAGTDVKKMLLRLETGSLVK